MRVTIIVDDNAVYIDGVMKAYAPNPLNLSSCGIPENVTALQWADTHGWIEFRDNPDGTKPANQPLTSLPGWANKCIDIWNEWEPYTPTTAL